MKISPHDTINASEYAKATVRRGCPAIQHSNPLNIGTHLVNPVTTSDWLLDPLPLLPPGDLAL